MWKKVCEEGVISSQQISKTQTTTRMHSSRMRTAHLLTVSQHALGGDVSQHVLGRGCVSQHALGRGTSAWGCLPRGCLPRGVCGRHPLRPEADTPPCEQNDRQV